MVRYLVLFLSPFSKESTLRVAFFSAMIGRANLRLLRFVLLYMDDRILFGPDDTIPRTMYRPWFLFFICDY